MLLQILICISQKKHQSKTIFNQMVDYFFMSSRTVHYIPVLKHTKHHGIKIRKPLRISRTPRYFEVLLKPPPPKFEIPVFPCTWLYCLTNYIIHHSTTSQVSVNMTHHELDFQALFVRILSMAGLSVLAPDDSCHRL